MSKAAAERVSGTNVPELAREFIARTAAQCGSSGRLPSLSALARASGLGRVTIWNAVHEMVLAGTLTAAPGRGIRLAGTPDTLPAPSRGSPMWVRTRDALLTDIQSGTFGRGIKLPIVKELTVRYGTSARVVRQALWALDQAGVLTRERHGFRVAALERPGSAGRIVVIANTRTVEILLRQSPRVPEFWRALERGARRLGTSLQIVAYHSAAGLERFPYFPYPDIVAFDQTQTVLGYVVLTFGFEPTWLDTIVSLLRRTGKPAAFIDELGQRGFERMVPGRPGDSRFRFCHVSATSSPGAAAGRYLTALGHRQVAIVSVDPEAPWSRERERGIREAMSAAGLSAQSATLFGLDKTDTGIERELGPIIEQFVALQKRLHAERDRLPPEEMEVFLRPEIMRSRLSALYDRIRAQAPGASAWVGTSDSAILPALVYLFVRGVSAPRDISLVGMDNTVEASADGLTSYDFAMTSVAESILEHVAGWSRFRGRNRCAELVEIPGVLVERNSSGPPSSVRKRN